MAGDTDNVWEGIKLRIGPDPFCKSCQITSTNKKARSKNPLKLKAPFKGGFMDIIPATVPTCLTSETTFSNYILNVDTYSKNSELYGMAKITTE